MVPVFNIHYTAPTPCLHLKEAALKVLQKYLFLALKKCQATYNTLRTRPRQPQPRGSVGEAPKNMAPKAAPQPRAPMTAAAPPRTASQAAASGPPTAPMASSPASAPVAASPQASGQPAAQAPASSPTPPDAPTGSPLPPGRVAPGARAGQDPQTRAKQQQQQQPKPKQEQIPDSGKPKRGRHATPAQERREGMHWLKKTCEEQTAEIRGLRQQVAAYASQLGNKDGQIFGLNARIHQLEA